jgi:dihydroxy-acid dehydratase
MRNQGLPTDMFEGKPVIGICNTWSELTPCNAHLRGLATAVREGVLEAGGFPLEFPAMSLGETLMRPTTMLYRNLLAMEAEESIRANPCDGVVLLCGCDKTTPGLVMGAASVDLPSIVVSGGPMLNGWRGAERLGNGTTGYRMMQEIAAGAIGREEVAALEIMTARSPGSCNTMGTASSMASMMEALGLALPQNGATPAVDSRRVLLARQSGRRIVEMVNSDLRLSRFATADAFRNAIRVNAAIGGSTNAVIHLLAIAGRVGIPLTLDDWERFGRDVPCLVDLMPSGRFLMEDFFYAGGIPAVMAEVADLLQTDCETVSGLTIGQIAGAASNFNPEVIRRRDNPVAPRGGVAVLRGSLAPDGAIIKPSAADPALMSHRGRALVFDSLEDYRARVDDPDLPVDRNSILVLRGCGPRGFPGMPEVGNMTLPRKLLREGVRDMVRISDARMSGTAFGTVVLHVAPEAAALGPLAAVETGDEIVLDVAAGRLDLLVDEETLQRRQAALPVPARRYETGWERLYADHVLQADRGADFDILVGCRGSTPRRRWGDEDGVA